MGSRDYLINFYYYYYYYYYYYMCTSHTVRRKIFATEKFRESLPKRGGRNIRDKNIREGGSDTLRNTITWLLVCVARRIFDGR